MNISCTYLDVFISILSLSNVLFFFFNRRTELDDVKKLVKKTDWLTFRYS